MIDIYNKVSKKIELIDFDELWKGFEKTDFALYDDKIVVMKDKEIPVDDRFIGNTAIEYEEELLAIWKIHDKEEVDIDRMASLIVHEMFHAFQYSSKLKITVNDFDKLKYPLNKDNYRLLYEERRYLVNAFKTDNIEEKRHYLKKYIDIRNSRKKIIKGIFNYEIQMETLEGQATAVELKTLKLLSRQKYEKEVSYICELLSCINEKLFDIRRASYLTGALLILIAEELGIKIEQDLSKSVYLYNDISKFDYNIEKGIKLDTGFDEAEFKKEYDNYVNEIKNKIDSILNQDNAKTITGKFKIVLYDPMNMARYNKYIYHSLVAVKEGKEVTTIKKPCVTIISDKDDYRNCENIIMGE
ncbi:hypothetical protein PV797_08690 [Clostridiaceae bacterium M8S5]|nr:hypothetical protein PV797_08690 [Clostridiaceae bacterium M8S5]